jgi:hypothetical protein
MIYFSVLSAEILLSTSPQSHHSVTYLHPSKQARSGEDTHALPAGREKWWG